MVEAAPLPISLSHAERKRPISLLPVIAIGVLACAALFAASQLSSPNNGPVELDRRETEIEKLQQEKQLLEQQLSHQRQPLIHPATIKAAAQPHAAVATATAVHHANRKPVVSDLKAEKKALEQQLATTAKNNAGDPWVEGVLGTFKAKAGDGLLGHLKDTTDNVMGSLAATMTSAQRLKMLTNEAKAMGDVSPKEALAQRVISIGKELLAHKPVSLHAAGAALKPLPAAAPAHMQQLQARKVQAATRLASRHAGEAKKAVGGEGKPAAAKVAAAKERVALLKRELGQAQRVEHLEQALAHAKQSLHHTESKVTVAKGQQLVARLDGADGKYKQARESAKKFLGLSAQAEEEREEEEREHEAEEEEAEEEEKKAEDCRFRGDCHAQGYVKGGIVVGTAENTGPDRYGQLGAGPQLLKGRVGDNVVGAGLLGATGVYEDDVLVPTRLSGVRARDTYKSNENPHAFKELDPETRDELIHGSVMHHYGDRKRLGIRDERVPIYGMSAEEYRDRARTQQLAAH